MAFSKTRRELLQTHRVTASYDGDGVYAFACLCGEHWSRHTQSPGTHVQFHWRAVGVDDPIQNEARCTSCGSETYSGDMFGTVCAACTGAATLQDGVSSTG